MSLLTSFVPSFVRASSSAAREGGETVRPVYDLAETGEGYALAVQLPGVAKEGLELTVEAEAITVRGRRAWKQPEGWAAFYRESSEAPFELVVSHDNVVALDRVQAELRDGVLKVTLPKAETAKPRKITVA